MSSLEEARGWAGTDDDSGSVGGERFPLCDEETIDLTAPTGERRRVRDERLRTAGGEENEDGESPESEPNLFPSPSPATGYGPCGTKLQQDRVAGLTAEDTGIPPRDLNLSAYPHTPLRANDHMTSQSVQVFSLRQFCRWIVILVVVLVTMLALVVVGSMVGNKLSMLESTPGMASAIPHVNQTLISTEIAAMGTPSPSPLPNGTWTPSPAPVPHLDPIQSLDEKCSHQDFQAECTTTNFCELIYATAEDCKISEGGVCYCAGDEVCGCL